MRLKKFIPILAFLWAAMFISFHALPQDKKVKSYSSYKGKSAQKDIEELLAEVPQLMNKNTSMALSNVESALAMSLSLHDVFNEARCYVLLGEINEGIEEWKLALGNFSNAYQILNTSYRGTQEFKRTLKGLGNTNLKLGNYEESLRYYQEALALKLSDSGITEQKLGISEVYFQMGKYQEALQALEENKRSSKIADPALDLKIENQKAKIYARLNELGKAQEIFNSSQNTLRSNTKAVPKMEEKSLKSAKEEIAEVLHEQKRYDEEIELLNNSIEYNLESNNLDEVSKDKVGIGNALIAKGETIAALKVLEEAANIADSTGNPKEQAAAFLQLAGLYEKHGQTTQALSAYKRYSEAVSRVTVQSESIQFERTEVLKQQKGIEEVTKRVSIGLREETIERATVFRQQLIIYGLLVFIIIITVTAYFIYKNAMASKKANLLLALKSLRSQMNPHFIFNALNSVNHFIAQNDERTANKFLSDFSRLMRLVLENSQEDFIPFYKEEEIITLYLKLEHYRFRDKFDYDITVDENLNKEAIEIPPMLLQPYIENAVWHGLRYKESKGQLSLDIRQEGENLLVEVTDNGIGRKRSAELKTENQKKHSSTGLKNIQERLFIINKVYNAQYKVFIEDADPSTATGTRVKIIIPINK